MSDTDIQQLETWYCRIPLETPIVLGDMVISHRDFVVVRLRTRSGAEGVAYSLTRGAPLDLVLSELIGPRLLGRDALDTAGRHEELTRGVVMLGAVGLVGRAISLVDIALWDLKGRLAGLPVWRLLGGYRQSAPVLLVAPYAGADESDDAYAERLAPFASRGYATIKLYPMTDPEAMRQRLTVIRQHLGTGIGLVVDMAWSFRSAADAIAAVRMWEGFDLTWVEDPFPPDEWRSIRALSDAVATPIAVGDEVSVRATTERLIDERAVDVLRLDATSIGGFTGFDSLRDQAVRAGYVVSPHAYAEIHQHCVFGWPGVEPVEIFLPGSPTWGASRFLSHELDLSDGSRELAAPTEPGLRLQIDWKAVEALSSRHTITTP
jgi:L-alanine-DL-glutamate epimerase-like enolase superfamily enzyme